jgi:hypothetical protein
VTNLSNGTTIYTDPGLSIPISENSNPYAVYLSDGVSYWNIGDNPTDAGKIFNETSCTPPSPTPSITKSTSISATPSISISTSISKTPSISISKSISRTPSITLSRTPSVTPSISISKSISNTPSISISKSISNTPSITPSRSVAAASVTPSISISKSISNTPSTSPAVTTFTVNIYAKTDVTFLGGAALYTSTDNVNWTRRGSAMGTGCVVKYGPVSIANGTTIYYQVADNAVNPGSGGDTYFHGASTNTTCPAASTSCVGSFVVTANTNRALTAQEIVC